MGCKKCQKSVGNIDTKWAKRFEKTSKYGEPFLKAQDVWSCNKKWININENNCEQLLLRFIFDSDDVHKRRNVLMLEKVRCLRHIKWLGNTIIMVF